MQQIISHNPTEKYQELRGLYVSILFSQFCRKKPSTIYSNVTTHKQSQLLLPDGCTDIWLVILFFSFFKPFAILDLIHFLNRDILLKASAILFVSWSAVGADKLDEPKFDKSKAKKRLRTWYGKVEKVSCSI